jgi:hypothetical protein
LAAGFGAIFARAARSFILCTLRRRLCNAVRALSPLIRDMGRLSDGSQVGTPVDLEILRCASNDINRVILRREDAEGSRNTRLEILRRFATLAAQDDVEVISASPARAPLTRSG